MTIAKGVNVLACMRSGELRVQRFFERGIAEGSRARSLHREAPALRPGFAVGPLLERMRLPKPERLAGRRDRLVVLERFAEALFGGSVGGRACGGDVV